MKLRSTLRLIFASVLLSPLARAETWRTSFGDKVEGTLSGVYGTYAMIAGNGLSTRVPLEQLDDAGLGRVADFLAARAAAAGPWSASTSKVAKSVKGQLQVLKDGKLVKFEPGARPEPEVYLVYFGADWCGPCKRFSPDLKKAYQRLKAAAPDYFELVFISSDRDSGEQLSYVREVGMPWTVLRYGSLGSVAPLERWAGTGIPCLVAVTREGEAIYHSYVGSEYVGPQRVLTQFEDLLRATLGQGGAVQRARHRLALVQHQRAAAGGASPVKPYLIEFDKAKYRTLTVKEFTASLVIDEKGRVAEAKFEPEFPSALDFQLQQDVREWLFLPSVENGQPKGQKVTLPIKL